MGRRERRRPGTIRGAWLEAGDPFADAGWDDQHDGDQGEDGDEDGHEFEFTIGPDGKIVEGDPWASDSDQDAFDDAFSDAETSDQGTDGGEAA